jgi:hypothetical protein
MSSVNIRRLRTDAPDFDEQLKRLHHWSAETDGAIEQRVASILADVQQRGDAAVLEFTERFDALPAESVAALKLSRESLQQAFEAITPAQRSAFGAITNGSWKPVAAAGSTATKTARCWARRSRRWTASASTCPAARPRTRRRC